MIIDIPILSGVIWMDLVSPFLMKSWNPVPNREKAPTLSWLNPQYHPVGVLLIWFSQPIIESGVIILWSKIVVQKPFIILIQFLLTSPQLSLHVKLAVYGLSWLCPRTNRVTESQKWLTMISPQLPFLMALNPFEPPILYQERPQQKQKAWDFSRRAVT